MIAGFGKGNQQRAFLVGYVDCRARPGQLQGSRVEPETSADGGWAYPARQGLNRRVEFFHRSRLGEIDVRAAAVTLDFVAHLLAGRDHDDADFGQRLADAPRQAEAVFSGKIEIEDQDVCPEGAQFVIQRFGAIHAAYHMAQIAQGFNGDFTQFVVIFDNNDIQRGSHNSNLTSSVVGR